MAIIRDALSCTALAVAGAACLATAANPLTAAAVVGPVALGAASNLANGMWSQIDRIGAAKALRAWRGIDENHVVVQALRHKAGRMAANHLELRDFGCHMT